MILQKLSDAVGVSGQEQAVRNIILEAIEGYADDIRIDPMGSITALKKGTGKNRPRVMISAHMDEVGFMVKGYDSNGLVRFTNVGGIDARILPGLQVKVGDKQLPGVIVWPPIHMNRSQNTVGVDKLRIDIGAKDKSAAQGKVKRGERIAFATQFQELSALVVRGKAFDDRVGCALLVDILQGGPYAVDVLAAFTVQEEVGLRGAKVAAQTLLPDAAFALEGTTAHDIPNPLVETGDSDSMMMGDNPACRLGHGPALTVMDRSMVAHNGLLRFLRGTANTNDIPYQLKTALGGGTDAGIIHRTAGGIPSAVISTPCRYIHSPAAYLNKEDYNNGLKLVQAALNSITFEDLKHR